MYSIELLTKGLLDPHQEIKAFAQNLLEEKIGKEETQKIILNLIGSEETATNKNWWKFWAKNKED